MDIELHHAFFFLTAVFVAGLLVLWFYDDWRDGRRGWSVAEDQLGECPRCRMAFLFGDHETVVRCPRCSALCQSRRRGEANPRRPA